MDYTGINHLLVAGSLEKIGWNNYVINIPSAIPQSKKYLPKFEALKLTKIVVRTAPDEDVSGFYLYVDHIKALTDVHETMFDGNDLADKTKIQDIWGSQEAGDE